MGGGRFGPHLALSIAGKHPSEGSRLNVTPSGLSNLTPGPSESNLQSPSPSESKFG